MKKNSKFINEKLLNNFLLIYNSVWLIFLLLVISKFELLDSIDYLFESYTKQPILRPEILSWILINKFLAFTNFSINSLSYIFILFSSIALIFNNKQLILLSLFGGFSLASQPRLLFLIIFLSCLVYFKSRLLKLSFLFLTSLFHSSIVLLLISPLLFILNIDNLIFILKNFEITQFFSNKLESLIDKQNFYKFSLVRFLDPLVIINILIFANLLYYKDIYKVIFSIIIFFWIFLFLFNPELTIITRRILELVVMLALIFFYKSFLPYIRVYLIVLILIYNLINSYKYAAFFF